MTEQRTPNVKFQQTLLILAVTFCMINLSEQQRSKRFLTFPRTSPTRLQIIAGIGIPVDLELESVTIGYVFKAEYFLPENASNYLNFLADPFDLTTRPIGSFSKKKRDLTDESVQLAEEPAPTEAPTTLNKTSGYDAELHQKFEKYVVQPEEIASGTNSQQNAEEDELSDADYWNQESKGDWMDDPLRPKQPQNLATSRWTVYKGMAALAESKGLEGRPCVLRSICESAHASFDYSNGILGELMHIIMTPSLTKDEISDNSDFEYLKAEKLGKSGAPCDKVFKECTASILDQFSGVYTPMMDLINNLLA